MRTHNKKRKGARENGEKEGGKKRESTHRVPPAKRKKKEHSDTKFLIPLFLPDPKEREQKRKRTHLRTGRTPC